MDTQLEIELHRAVGMSDLSALLSEAFRFPADGRLAEALSDGSFASDWQASLRDAHWENAYVEDGACAYEDLFQAYGDRPSPLGDEGAMRREYSRLFLAPGSEVPIWPYESAFLHRAAGHTEVPNLFQMQTTVDTQRQMVAAGVRPENLRTEPCDLCATELGFVSYLYARWADELRTADGVCADTSDWPARISKFAQSHILRWFPDFLNQVKEQSCTPEYQLFADLGLLYLTDLANDTRRFGGEEEVR